jgi:hypothetical protein
VKAIEVEDCERLSVLARELRSAARVALSVGSWFAPTLDDCRLDAEQLLSVDAEQRSSHDLHLVRVRAELVLRTWSRIVALTGIEPPRCEACQEGLLVEVARPGRVVPFRGLQIELPPDFAIPTCERCGTETLDAIRGARLDELLFSEYLRRT